MSTPSSAAARPPVQLSLERMERNAARLHAARRLEMQLNRFPKAEEIDAVVAKGWGKSWKQSAAADRTAFPHWRASDALVLIERDLAPNQQAWFRRMVGEPIPETEEQYAARTYNRWGRRSNLARNCTYPAVEMSGIGQDLMRQGKAAAKLPRYRVARGTIVGLCPPSGLDRGSEETSFFRLALPFDVVFLASEVESLNGLAAFVRNGYRLRVHVSLVEQLPSFADERQQLALAA